MSETYFPFPPVGVQPEHEFVFFENFLNNEECETIIDIGKNIGLVDATIINSGNIPEELEVEYRKSKTSFIDMEAALWLYQRLIQATLQINDHYFRFDLWGFAESLQFAEYNEPDGKYDTHIDCIPGQAPRKLSIVVQLTDDTTYEGGDFELMTEVPPRKLHRSKGTLLVFPSYLAHRVTPVTKGIRHSLVGWVSGKPFT